MQVQGYSVQQMVDMVNAWCAKHKVTPVHNGAGLRVTVRNIRYYQTLGLVDRPLSSNGRGFGEKHRLQLVAIRFLQAKGLPLAKIQTLLYGRSEEDLREIETRGLEDWEQAPSPSSTDWKISPITPEILLLTRDGREVTAAQRLKIQELLNTEPMEINESPGLESTSLESFRPETD
jgi:DNA-binding transcriptional MerR regulator